MISTTIGISVMHMRSPILEDASIAVSTSAVSSFWMWKMEIVLKHIRSQENREAE